MKIKMLEYYQGRGRPSLIQGKEYSAAEIGVSLADWLVEHRKAEIVAEKPVQKKAPQKAEAPAPKKALETAQKKPVRARASRGSKKK